MSRFSDIPDHSFSNYRPSQMGRAEFATIFGNVFEHSAWIVMQAWDTGLTPRDDTAAGLCSSLSMWLKWQVARRKWHCFALTQISRGAWLAKVM
jgi:2-oxo-4-hydroxy-4-carboxy--5-ureidoimidazoline (OHCU) decarboxylase